MVLDRDRLAVEVRLGIVGGVPTVSHRDRAEIPAGGTRQMHVALGDHRDLRGRRGQPVWIGVGVVDTGGVGALNQPHLHLTEAHSGAFVESPICHNAFRDPGGHRDGGLLDGGTRRATTVVDLGEELQVPDTGGPRDRDLRVGVHGECHHAVDVGRCQAGIIKCGRHGFGCQSKFTATGVLGKVGGTDPGDRGFTG